MIGDLVADLRDQRQQPIEYRVDLLRVLRQGQRQGKLIAAQTRHLIPQPGLAQQRLADPLEQLIPLLVSEEIVYLLKIT